jgi:hypothetical protein
MITYQDLPHLIKSEGGILIYTEYKHFLKIYTDGSKDPQNNTNGYAFVIPELKVSKGFKLQSRMSIFMCEPANSFPSIPTWLGIHSKITFMPILLSDVKLLYISHVI